MQQKDLIYEVAKENLKKYGRNFKKTVNEKVIYECAAIIFSIKKEYMEDTRNYTVPQSIYNIYQDMILKLQDNIIESGDYKEEAKEACLNVLIFMDIIVGCRLELIVSAS